MWRTVFTIARKIPRIRAHTNPSTLNPGTILAARSIRTAFITKVKSPRVKRLIGRVKIRRTGFIIAFIIPKTRAVIRAAVKLAT